MCEASEVLTKTTCFIGSYYFECDYVALKKIPQYDDSVKKLKKRVSQVLDGTSVSSTT